MSCGCFFFRLGVLNSCQVLTLACRVLLRGPLLVGCNLHIVGSTCTKSGGGPAAGVNTHGGPS